MQQKECIQEPELICNRSVKSLIHKRFVFSLPWVPEPQNLHERKFFPSLFFSFYYFLALVPRVCLAKKTTILNSISPNTPLPDCSKLLIIAVSHHFQPPPPPLIRYSRVCLDSFFRCFECISLSICEGLWPDEGLTRVFLW